MANQSGQPQKTLGGFYKVVIHNVEVAALLTLSRKLIVSSYLVLVSIHRKSVLLIWSRVTDCLLSIASSASMWWAWLHVPEPLDPVRRTIITLMFFFFFFPRDTHCVRWVVKSERLTGSLVRKKIARHCRNCRHDSNSVL